jgi:hypothetical protein
MRRHFFKKSVSGRRPLDQPPQGLPFFFFHRVLFPLSIGDGRLFDGRFHGPVKLEYTIGVPVFLTPLF